MAISKIYIHSVFSTKQRRPILAEEKRKMFFQHIVDHAKEKNIVVDTIGGHVDHIHLLVQLHPTQSLSEVMRSIKGESAWWANRQRLFGEHLIWSRTFFATSVNPFSLARLKGYIQNQEEHHKKISFDQEYNDFLKKHSS